MWSIWERFASNSKFLPDIRQYRQIVLSVTGDMERNTVSDEYAGDEWRYNLWEPISRIDW